ncbi:MAG: hypothetical protein EP329_12950 [Deltaproteobacteria bacterium]|nr:MAG: hypothetical protein EP329_12950 [Deltaproteobacteria bacterium]
MRRTPLGIVGLIALAVGLGGCGDPSRIRDAATLDSADDLGEADTASVGDAIGWADVDADAPRDTGAVDDVAIDVTDADDTAVADAAEDTSVDDTAEDAAVADTSEAVADASDDVVDTSDDVADASDDVTDASDDATGADTVASADTTTVDTTAAPDGSGTPALDFALEDVNPTSATYQLSVSPRDYLEEVSVFYFMHSS